MSGKPQNRSRPRLTVYKDSYTGGYQMSIEDDAGGFRLKGPTFNGSSQPIMSVELDDRAMTEIETYIRQYRAAAIAAAEDQTNG